MKDGGIINRFSRCAWDWALHQVLHEVLAFIVMVTFDLLSNSSALKYFIVCLYSRVSSLLYF